LPRPKSPGSGQNTQPPVPGLTGRIPTQRL